MRYVLIDLSSDNYLEQPKIFGGYAGEHNETVLQVKLPKRMLGAEYSGYRFEFQTSEDNKIICPLISSSKLDDDILSFPLAEQLTVAGNLLFNIAAISLNGSIASLISKTNMVTLYIGDSSDGNDVPLDPNGYKDEMLEIVDQRITKAISTKQDKLTAGDNITIEDNVIDAKVNNKLSYTSKNPIENGKNWNFVNKLSGALTVRERDWSNTQLKAISNDIYDVAEEVFNSNKVDTLLPNQNIGDITTSNSPYFDLEDAQTLTFKPSKITDNNGNYTYDGKKRLMLFTDLGERTDFDFENSEEYDISDYGYYVADTSSEGKDMFSVDGGVLKTTSKTSKNNTYACGALVLKKNGKPVELTPGAKYNITFKYRYNKQQTNNSPWIVVTQGANYGTVNGWNGVTADSAIMSDAGNYTYATSSSAANHRGKNKITGISTEWKTFTKDFIAYDVSSDKIKNYLCLTICAGAGHCIEIDDIVVVEEDDTNNTGLLRLDAGTYRIKYSYMMSGSLRDKLVNFKENNTWLEQPPFVRFMDNLDENSYKCIDPYTTSDKGYNPDAIIIGENICKHMGTFWGNTWYDDEIIFKVPEGRSNTRLDKDGNEIQSGFFGIYIGNLYNDFSIKNIVIEKLVISIVQTVKQQLAEEGTW